MTKYLDKLSPTAKTRSIRVRLGFREVLNIDADFLDNITEKTMFQLACIYVGIEAADCAPDRIESAKYLNDQHQLVYYYAIPDLDIKGWVI